MKQILGKMSFSGPPAGGVQAVPPDRSGMLGKMEVLSSDMAVTGTSKFGVMR